jgi:predicted Zn-dependent protease
LNPQRKIEIGLAALLAACCLAVPRQQRHVDPHEFEAAAGFAQVLARHGEADAGMAVCEDLLSRTSHPFVRLRAAETCYRAGRFERAEALYRELAVSEPASPLALFNLAQALHRQGRTREAEDCRARFDEMYGPLFPGVTADNMSAQLNAESRDDGAEPSVLTEENQ